jgi:hypothetical protein
VKTRYAGIVDVAVNVVLGLAFIHSGAATRLWERVESDVPWRNGPTAMGVLVYLTLVWCAWAVVQLVFRRVVVASAARACVAACVIVSIQVLAGGVWLPVTLATLLAAMLVNAYIVRESLRRTIVAWAWSGAGVALATLLIHPYFIGLPLFVVRLAVLMTMWDWLGERLGVTPRLLRLVPTFYLGSSPSSPSSPRVAAQARVTR